MTRHPASLADSVSTIARHMLEVSAKLRAGSLSGADLHIFGNLLSALVETVHLHADKLGSPASQGHHTLEELPAHGGEPPPAR